MTVEHHDLHHEFPELQDKIHALKVGDAHFRKLFDEYHDLTNEIEKIENAGTPVSSLTDTELKQRRVKLKDQLYAMLIKE